MTSQDIRVQSLTYAHTNAEDSKKAIKAEVATAKADGRVITEADLGEHTLADGTAIQTIKKSGRWVNEEFHNDAQPLGVFLNEDATRIVKRFYALTGEEIDRKVKQADNHAAARKMHRSAEEAFAKIVASAKRKPQTLSRYERSGFDKTYTITELDTMLDTCSGKVKTVRNGAACVIEAADPTEISVAVGEAEQRISHMTERAAIRTLGLKYGSAVRGAVFVLDALGSLGLEYANTGKRPKADVGRGLADRLGPSGIWLS